MLPTSPAVGAIDGCRGVYCTLPAKQSGKRDILKSAGHAPGKGGDTRDPTPTHPYGYPGAHSDLPTLTDRPGVVSLKMHGADCVGFSAFRSLTALLCSQHADDRCQFAATCYLVRERGTAFPCASAAFFCQRLMPASLWCGLAGRLSEGLRRLYGMAPQVTCPHTNTITHPDCLCGFTRYVSPPQPRPDLAPPARMHARERAVPGVREQCVRRRHAGREPVAAPGQARFRAGGDLRASGDGCTLAPGEGLTKCQSTMSLSNERDVSPRRALGTRPRCTSPASTIPRT